MSLFVTFSFLADSRFYRILYPSIISCQEKSTEIEKPSGARMHAGPFTLAGHMIGADDAVMSTVLFYLPYGEIHAKQYLVQST
jgi:hypothetical protein